MENQYHILNGEALKEQFPTSIQGERIIMQECLVEGEVEAKNLKEFWEVRAEFIHRAYPEYSRQDYFDRVVPEFEKMMNISKEAEVNLWFEDDLFCQVNFWFLAYLLNQYSSHQEFFLVRPPKHTPYGFGGLDASELIQAYQNRQRIQHLADLAKLWEYYQAEQDERLLEAAQALKTSFPFILPAVEAHIQRRANAQNLGRPKEALIRIMKELDTQNFGPVFQAFNKRESIYGFGDLQVKRFFDEILEQHAHRLE